MGKISKKNQDPGQTDRDRTALEIFMSKKSQHFASGTGVIYQGRRYTVNQIVHKYKVVVLIDEEGKALRVDNPYFLNQSSTHGRCYQGREHTT